MDADHRPCKPELRRALHLLYARLQIVYVEHRNTLEPLGVGAAVLGDPVVISPAVDGQEITVRHAVEHKANGGIEYTHINPIDIHVFDVLIRDVTSKPYVFKGIPINLYFFRRLKPQTCLRSTLNSYQLVSVAVPPIDAMCLADNVRCPVFELGLCSACPHVRRLYNVIIR